MKTMSINIFKKHFVLVWIMIATIASVYSQSDANKFKRILDEAYHPEKSKTIYAVFEKSDIKNNKHARVVDNRYIKYRGKLVAFCKEGVFIAETKVGKVHYIRYNNIKQLKLGRSYGFFVNAFSMAVGTVTGLAFMTDGAEYFPVGFIAGYSVAASYGQLFYGLPYAVGKAISKLNYNIDEDLENFTSVVKESESNEMKFGNPYFYNLTTTDETPKKESPVASENGNSNKIESNGSNQNSQNGTTVTPTKSNQKFMVGQKFGDNKSIEVKWMVHEFNNTKVKENELQNTFRNIRGMQLTADQLSKYSTSQIQFLAMMICSGGGYNMKEVVALTDAQRKILGFYESGYLEDMKADGSIQTLNLADIDIENLRVIFDELNSR